MSADDYFRGLSGVGRHVVPGWGAGRKASMCLRSTDGDTQVGESPRCRENPGGYSYGGE